MWYSRKFRIMVLDAAFSTLAIVLTLAFIPAVVTQILILVALWQPIIVACVVGIAYEDGMEKRALGLKSMFPADPPDDEFPR